MTTKKPTAELRILARPSGALTYLLYDEAGELLWQAYGYSTQNGRDRVRARLKEWNNGRYRITMKADDQAA